MLINNEDEDNDDAIGPESIDNCGNTRKVVRPSETLPKRLVVKAQQSKTCFLTVFHIFGILPLLLYSYFVKCTE